MRFWNGDAQKWAEKQVFVNAGERAKFEDAVARTPAVAALREAAHAVRAGDSRGRYAIATAFMHAAFCDPFAVTPVYDAFASGWLGGPVPEHAPHCTGLALPAQFWTDFWALFDARRQGRVAPGDVTGLVAALGRSLPEGSRVLSEEAAQEHPKSAEAHTRAMPRKLTLEELARRPKGSLAADFHALIVANGFDLEVMDRDALNLATLPPALRYLNTRILQMHDVWHLVGGYHFTALHEVAVSAFQLAQFNHGYSAMFLASAVTGAAFEPTSDSAPVLQTIAEAWRHGRETPSLMAIPWEDEWHLPIAELRTQHGIKPFAGSLPPDLFERLKAA
jgi:ubiquinone biosynthesis protein Coq4